MNVNVFQIEFRLERNNWTHTAGYFTRILVNTRREQGVYNLY